MVIRLFTAIALVSIASAEPATPTVPAKGPNGDPLPVKEKIIALTFDDGPLPDVTPRVLKALAAHGFRATFCVLGERIAARPDLAKAYVDAGHELASHSWDHPFFTKIDDDAARVQLHRTQDAIVAATGRKPVLFRPPYFAIDPGKSEIVHREFGYTLLFDSLNGRDWVKPAPTPQETIRQVADHIRPGDIVLLHESFPNTVEALPELVNVLSEKGFRSVTVSELQSIATAPK
jgi:peptidoglycan/xylan/chitin deacetylase (PgdA/CDA1 family)